MAKARACKKNCFGCPGESPDECPTCLVKEECEAEALDSDFHHVDTPVSEASQDKGIVDEQRKVGQSKATSDASEERVLNPKVSSDAQSKEAMEIATHELSRPEAKELLAETTVDGPRALQLTLLERIEEAACRRDWDGIDSLLKESKTAWNGVTGSNDWIKAIAEEFPPGNIDYVCFGQFASGGERDGEQLFKAPCVNNGFSTASDNDTF